MTKTLTESEKVEQLMRPRWKIVADYPHSPLPAGSLLDGNGESFCVSRTHYQDFGELHSQNNYMPEAYLFGLPHLFRKLEWWEERTPEEMPEYVRDEVTGKILRIEYRIDSHTPCEVKTWNEFEKPFWNILQDLLPATEAEYNEYLTLSQAGER